MTHFLENIFIYSFWLKVRKLSLIFSIWFIFQIIIRIYYKIISHKNIKKLKKKIILEKLGCGSDWDQIFIVWPDPSFQPK